MWSIPWRVFRKVGAAIFIILSWGEAPSHLQGWKTMLTSVWDFIVQGPASWWWVSFGIVVFFAEEIKEGVLWEWRKLRSRRWWGQPTGNHLRICFKHGLDGGLYGVDWAERIQYPTREMVSLRADNDSSRSGLRAMVTNLGDVDEEGVCE